MEFSRPWGRAQRSVLYVALGLYLFVVVGVLFQRSVTGSLLSIAQCEQGYYYSSDPAGKESCWYQNTWWKTEFFTEVHITDVLLAAFTGFLVVVGTWQGVQLRRTVDHMEGAAETQLRAYVYQEIAGWRGITDGRPLGLCLALINQGQTPAKNAWNVGTIKILPFPLPDDYDFPLPAPQMVQRASVMPREANSPKGWITSGDPFSQQELDEITTVGASRRAWAYGVLTYEDVFGKEHHTRYCWSLDPASIIYRFSVSAGREIDTWIWATHHRHTDFD